MKYVIIIPDGCADEPQDSLGSRTPLQAAHIPTMDAIAQRGIVGQANHVPDGFTPGSEVANLSLLGYDPRTYFTGRAPLEAAAQRIALGANDWAVRCNLVHVSHQIMTDFTAGHISTEESRELLARLQQHVGLPALEFIPGVSYRNLLLYRGDSAAAPFTSETWTMAPHDLTDQSIRDAYPRGPGSEVLTQLMELSHGVFADHAVNQTRAARGQRVATHVWLWGLGQAPRLTAFHERFGLKGAMITAVDLLRGLAHLVGWDCIDVPGATGYLDTDYRAKGQYAVAALERYDVVCVHVEATDEASHEGRAAAKVEALERIDDDIVSPLWSALNARGEFRIWITPDHPTFLRTKMHSPGVVPWTIAGTGIQSDGAESYDEVSAAQGQRHFPDGSQQMEFFVCR